MSMPPATYTCDECGYQAAALALVVEHLRTAHGITDAGQVGSIEQSNGLLILRSGDHETVIELDTWLAEHLGETPEPTQPPTDKPPTGSVTK